jgi:hypothetical protein
VCGISGRKDTAFLSIDDVIDNEKIFEMKYSSLLYIGCPIKCVPLPMVILIIFEKTKVTKKD